VLLPENVVNDLINKGKHIPEIHNNVSILFFDFVGFTNMTTQMNPQVLIEELSGIFTDFDEICSKHHATRIKTIGDAFMVYFEPSEDSLFNAVKFSKQDSEVIIELIYLGK
jgi:class 3 adenylate cyclase